MTRRQFRARFGVHANDHRVEHLADAPFGALLDAVNQQTALRLRGLNVVAQLGDLPAPVLDKPIPDGAQYLVHLDFNGQPINRLFTWRETQAQISPNQEVLDGTARTSSPTEALQTGEWIAEPRNWVTALAADKRPKLDVTEGDTWLVNEHDHEELWDFDGTAWQNLYSADRVKAWIAALNLFEGTTVEDGHVTPGAVDFSKLPNLSANALADAELSAHYFTFVGSPGYAIKATDPNGLGADLAGAMLNPGDWIQVVNRGTIAAPDLHWVHIGGDLLAKSRGDMLYGLQPWADGSWEQGSLVLRDGDIYRALKGIVAGDPDPIAAVVAPAVQPWEKLGISGGLKIAQTDPGTLPGALPVSAPAGEVWLVLQSAKAGNQQALFAYDTAAGEWQELGGGGVPLDLSGGEELINIGLPIGTIVAYFNIMPPPGWLLCNGQVCPAIYKEIQPYLWDGRVPDLRGQFIMGSESDANDQINGFTRHQDTTRLPRKDFKARHPGVTASIPTRGGDYDNSLWNTDSVALGAGSDRHSRDLVSVPAVEMTVTGGDPITRPPFVVMAYIIKVADRAIRSRIVTP